MSAALAGTAYIWLAQGLAFLLMPRSIALGVRARALLFWAATAPVVLAVQAPMSMLLLAAVLMLVFAPVAPVDRAAFFIIAVPAVPVFVFSPLTLPGINHLMDLTHYKFASLVVLAQVLLYGWNSAERPTRGLPVAAMMAVMFVAYSMALTATTYGFTSALRYGLDQILFLILPVFAVVVALRKPEDVDKFFQAILLVSLLLATAALVSSFKRWDMYAVGGYFPTDIRDGSVRINATAGTHALAFHLAAGFVVLEYLRRRVRIGWLSVNMIRLVLIAGMLTTDSRGALAGLAVALCVYTLFVLRSRYLRGLLFAGLLAAVFGGAVWLAQGNVDSLDRHGTFAYRQELLWTSLDYIARHPLFGDRHFLQSGHFDHLLQGQGIIDITNLYLQIALRFGLVGLALFAGLFVVPFIKSGVSLLPMRQARTTLSIDSGTNPSRDEIWFHAMAATVAMGAGWLFLVATTSDAGLSMYLGTILAALCCALQRVRPAESHAKARESKRPTRSRTSCGSAVFSDNPTMGDRIT